MNETDPADIATRLKHLRKVMAPAHFETLLHEHLRSLHSRSRYVGWFVRPVPIALMVAGGALVIAAYFVVPFYFSTSSSVPENSTISVPTGGQHDRQPAHNLPENGQLPVSRTTDSLSADSASTGKTDANTPKMP